MLTRGVGEHPLGTNAIADDVEPAQRVPRVNGGSDLRREDVVLIRPGGACGKPLCVLPTTLLSQCLDGPLHERHDAATALGLRLTSHEAAPDTRQSARHPQARGGRFQFDVLPPQRQSLPLAQASERRHRQQRREALPLRSL